MLVIAGAGIAGVSLMQGWGPRGTQAESMPAAVAPPAPMTFQASPAPAPLEIRATATADALRVGEPMIAGGVPHAGSNAPMSLDAAPAGGATVATRVTPTEPIQLPLIRAVAPPPTALPRAEETSGADSRANGALSDDDSETAEADAAIKAEFTAFVERLIPRLSAEVAAHPLDMWTQRYRPAIRSLDVSPTRNPTYPYSGFVTLEKRWTASPNTGGRSYDSTASTLDTLVFLYRDGRWEFSSGRSTGQMKIRTPGSGTLVNPVDSELSGDNRIRRATQAANG